MRNNPHDWHIDDLLVVAKQFDIECQNSGGSHHVFGYPGPVYIPQFLLLVDAVKELKK